MNGTPNLRGCSKFDIATPYLHLDMDKMERNIQAMVATCRKHKVQWRPHAKCHKSPEIARWLIDAGACGVTCATLDEALLMARSGITNLLIANMIAGPHKIRQLVELTQCAQPIICVDHIDQVRTIAQAMQAAGRSVPALIEIEIGLGRVGVAGGEAVVALAQQVHQSAGMDLAGIMAYEGHLLTIADPAEKESAIASAIAAAVACKQQIEAEGLPCPIVSCGGTGSYAITVRQPGVTEIQAGGAIFMDAFYRHACGVSDLEHALTVQATVVSRPAPDRAIMDAGRKWLNIEVHKPLVVSHPGVTVDWLSAEHGNLTVDPEQTDLRIGEQIALIPGYADLTNLLHEHFHAFRRERCERRIAIHRRGCP